MAQLNFEGFQPVGFGGRDCTPKIDAELRLRIQSLKWDTESDREHADEMLAKAFPEDKDYVCTFLKEQMTLNEKRKLQTYLVGGMSAVRTMDQAIDRAIAEAMRGQADA